MEKTKPKELTIHDYLNILYRGRWIILASTLVVMTYTLYYNLTALPVFEASAMVILKEEGGMQRKIFESSKLLQQDTMINNHVEILKSRTVAKEVIKRLQASDYADSLWFLGNKKGMYRFSLKQWILSLFKKQKSSRGRPSFEGMVNKFKGSMTSVVPKSDTDLIELRVRTYIPFEASFIANTWMEVYHDMDISESKDEVSEVKKFLENKMDDVQLELTSSEDDLKNYMERHGVTELTAETAQLIKRSADFEALYQEANIELEANKKRLSHLKAQLNESQRALLEEATSFSSPVIQELQKQIAQLIAEKAAYEQQLKGTDYYSEDDPRLLNMENRLRGVQDRIYEESRKMISGGAAAMNPLDVSEQLLISILQIETENISLIAKTNALGKIVGHYNRDLNTLPEKSLKLARLQRENEVNDKIFMMLREKYEESRIAEAGQTGSVRIVDYAEPPKRPIAPNKSKNLMMGLILGLGLGIGLTLVREYLDTSLKTIEDVERLGFEIIGTVPYISGRKFKQQIVSGNRSSQQFESRLITYFEPNSPIAEAYRTIRTSIQYTKMLKNGDLGKRTENEVKSVLVTSPGPGEGKSTSVANLAIAFAQMGMRTILIDTDLRRPVLHELFQLQRDPGLTNVLVRKTSIKDAIKKTQIKNLFLLTAGRLPKNPSEFLASKVMSVLIEKLQRTFDMVLFDSPPVIAVTDATLLSVKIDGVILVVRSSQTNRDALIRSRILLKQVDARLYGVLLNGLSADHRYGYYYDYYGYGHS